MMNTIIFRRLRVVGASLLNSNLCCKLFAIHPYHLRNVFSTTRSQTLFSNFASSKLNLSDADITRMLNLQPQLQKKVIQSLKKHGCTEVQIANILRLEPQLGGIAEKTLEPKLQLLEDFGFVGQNLAKLLTRSSYLLHISLENNILPTMEFLKNIFQSQEVLVKALLKSPRLLGCSLENTLKPSLAFWEGWGFSGTELVSFFQANPYVLTRTSLIPAQVDLIKKIGVDKDRKNYKYIVGIVANSRMETLEAKIENLKRCGLSVEETWRLLRAFPQALCYTEVNVSEKINFVVNEMELTANNVVKHPWLLSISLGKTVKPRFLVWQKIVSINASELPLFTVLSMTETRFINNIIEKHPESELLWRIYENAISNSSNCTKNLRKTAF